MVMEREYGPDQMKRFLKYELDNYLQGRAFERKKELPLLEVENQPYIHYRKGSLAMYALRDYIGEETLNAALARVPGGQEIPAAAIHHLTRAAGLHPRRRRPTRCSTSSTICSSTSRCTTTGRHRQLHRHAR